MPPSAASDTGVDVRTPPHLLLGADTHGVTRYAGELAGATGARVVRDADDLVDGSPVHLHLTDRLLGRDPARAAAAVEALARRVSLTVTLHDVPQPTDGRSFGDRARAYARVVRVSHAWSTSSWHEHALVRRWCVDDARGTVIPLPVFDLGPRPPRVVTSEVDPVVGVFGFVYPGKGHREVLEAAAVLRREGVPTRVRVLGGAAPGHDDEVEHLVRAGRAGRVPVEVTGRVAEADVARVLREVAVPVVGHRNVSASGSLNSWIAAGRRPLVRDGTYAREMATLRPGTITPFDDDSLASSLRTALLDPGSTWTAPGTDLRPGLDETAAAYRDWWATVWG